MDETARTLPSPSRIKKSLLIQPLRKLTLKGCSASKWRTRSSRKRPWNRVFNTKAEGMSREHFPSSRSGRKASTHQSPPGGTSGKHGRTYPPPIRHQLPAPVTIWIPSQDLGLISPRAVIRRPLTRPGLYGTSSTEPATSHLRWFPRTSSSTGVSSRQFHASRAATTPPAAKKSTTRRCRNMAIHRFPIDTSICRSLRLCPPDRDGSVPVPGEDRAPSKMPPRPHRLEDRSPAGGRFQGR